MYGLILKQSLSIITYDPLQMCGGVFICRDSACIFVFWASTLCQSMCILNHEGRLVFIISRYMKCLTKVRQSLCSLITNCTKWLCMLRKQAYDYICCLIKGVQ